MEVLRGLLGLEEGDSTRDIEIQKAIESSSGDIETAAAILISSETNTVEAVGSASQRELEGERGVFNDSDAALARRLQIDLNADSSTMRSFGVAEDDDEAMARRLQAELDLAAAGGDLQGFFGGSGSASATDFLLNEGPADVDIDSVISMFASDPDMLQGMLDELRNTLLPELSEAIACAEFPEIDEHIEEQNLHVKLGNLNVTDVILPSDQADLTFDPLTGLFSLTFAGIAATIENFTWGFKKGRLISASGKGTVSLKDVAVDAKLTLVQGTNVRVVECDVSVKDLKLKITGSAAGPLLNILLSLFKATLKAQLERALSEIVRSTLENTGGDLLQGSASRR